MDTHPLSRCKNCGHKVPQEDMHLVMGRGAGARFCGQCYRELVEKRTGYRQAKFEFESELASDPQDAPF